MAVPAASSPTGRARAPRLGPTLALAAAWVAIYLLYLAVRPEPPGPAKDKASVTTTTSARGAAGVSPWQEQGRQGLVVSTGMPGEAGRPDQGPPGG